MAERIVERISELDQLMDHWPGSTIHPVQTTAGSLDLKLDGAVDAELSVIRLSLSPRVIDCIDIDECRTGVVLVERPMISMGVEVTPPALLIHHSGRECRTVLEPEFRSLEFMLDNRLIENHLLGQLLADARSRQDQTIIPLSRDQASVLRGVADAYIGSSEDCGHEALQSCVQHQVRATVLDALVGVLEGNWDATLRRCSAPARGSIALAALRQMDRIGIENVRIGDLCKQLGVSRRAAEKSFERTLGTSPAQYVLACRLNNLRLSLLGPANRVADGLADCGFSDASRAARQYRRLFGELPSATLIRTRDRVLNNGG